jgi:hypothetical protein
LLRVLRVCALQGGKKREDHPLLPAADGRRNDATTTTPAPANPSGVCARRPLSPRGKRSQLEKRKRLPVLFGVSSSRVGVPVRACISSNGGVAWAWADDNKMKKKGRGAGACTNLADLPHERQGQRRGPHGTCQVHARHAWRVTGAASGLAIASPVHFCSKGEAAGRAHFFCFVGDGENKCLAMFGRGGRHVPYSRSPAHWCLPRRDGN